ncbi:MAG: hypothetical protein AAB346_02210, partial [Pseudomonadota bacterium]
MQAFLVAGRTEGQALLDSYVALRNHQSEMGDAEATAAERRYTLSNWIFLAIVLLGALMALVLGVLSLYRKQEILQRLFGVANRWVATHHIFDQLDKPYYGLNKLIHEKSRIWGACITVFSLCAIFLLIWYLRR